MYSELHREIEHLGNIILELQRYEQNPRHIAPNICDAYELALQYQRQLYECDSQKLRCKEVWNFLSYHVTRDHERSLGTEWDTGE